MHDVLADVLAASAAAALTKSVAAPAQRLRLLASAPYVPGDGLRSLLARVIKEQGVRALWRGNLQNLARYVPSVALNFALWGRLRDPEGSLAHNFAAGAAAGAGSLLVVYPLDATRVRVAREGMSSRSVTDTMRGMVRKEGVRGLYPRFGVSLLGVMAYRGVFFGGYEALRSDDSPLWQRWLAAQAAVVSAHLASYPLDMVRRRLWFQPPDQTCSARSVAKRMLREEGLATFYKGCGSAVFRGAGLFPTLVVFEEVRARLV